MLHPLENHVCLLDIVMSSAGPSIVPSGRQKNKNAKCSIRFGLGFDNTYQVTPLSKWYGRSFHYIVGASEAVCPPLENHENCSEAVPSIGIHLKQKHLAGCVISSTT